MRNKVIIALTFFILLIFMASCKKEAGPGGKNILSGTVLFKNGVTGNSDGAPRATIYIAYGASLTATSFDQIILSNNEGQFVFEGLNKGDYFLKAEYADPHGFVYNTRGYSVSLKTKKANTEVNMILE